MVRFCIAMFVYVRSVSLKYWESIFKAREVAENTICLCNFVSPSLLCFLHILNPVTFEIKIQKVLHQGDWLSRPGLESTLTIMSPFSPVGGIVQLFLKSIPLVLGTNLSLEVLKSISNLQDNMLKKESRQHTSCSQECSQTSGFTFVWGKYDQSLRLIFQIVQLLL